MNRSSTRLGSPIGDNFGKLAMQTVSKHPFCKKFGRTLQYFPADSVMTPRRRTRSERSRYTENGNIGHTRSMGDEHAFSSAYMENYDSSNILDTYTWHSISSRYAARACPNKTISLREGKTGKQRLGLGPSPCQIAIRRVVAGERRTGKPLARCHTTCQ